jgi:hypothetical protein
MLTRWNARLALQHPQVGRPQDFSAICYELIECLVRADTVEKVDGFPVDRCRF